MLDYSKDLVIFCSLDKSIYVYSGKKLTELSNAAENYHAVLTENRKLFNELQELKGTKKIKLEFLSLKICSNM